MNLLYLNIFKARKLFSKNICQMFKDLLLAVVCTTTNRSNKRDFLVFRNYTTLTRKELQRIMNTAEDNNNKRT